MAKRKPSVEELEDELAALEAELAELEGAPKRTPPKKVPREAKPEPDAPAEVKPKRGFSFGKKDKAHSDEAAPSDVEETQSRPRKLPFGFGKKKQAADASQPSEHADVPAAEPASKASRLSFGFGKKTAREESAQPSAAPEADAQPRPGSKLPFGLGDKKTHADEEPEPAPRAAPAPAADPPPQGDLTHWRHVDGEWVRAIPDHDGPILRRILDEDENVVREEAATADELDQVSGIKAERGVGKLFGGKSLRLPKLGRKNE